MGYTKPLPVTVTNSEGAWTATITVAPTPTVRVAADPDGIPTTTLTGSMYPKSIIQTVTDAGGAISTLTVGLPRLPTGGNQDGEEDHIPTFVEVVYGIPFPQYFSGLFLPSFIGLILSTLVQVVDSDVQAFTPFNALAWPTGAAALDSLCLRRSHVYGLASRLRLLYRMRIPFGVITAIMSLLAIILVPISGVAFGLSLRGTCEPRNRTQCVMALSVVPGMAKATIAILSAMGLLAAYLVLSLRGWRSAVARDPTSIAGLASIAGKDVPQLLHSGILAASRTTLPIGDLRKALGEERFALRHYWDDADGEHRYGIVSLGGDQTRREQLRPTPSQRKGGPESPVPRSSKANPRNMPFILLRIPIRATFTILLSGLLALLVYYGRTSEPTAFEIFMDSETAGVRILFSGIGIAILLFWDAFFAGTRIPSSFLVREAPANPDRCSYCRHYPFPTALGLTKARRAYSNNAAAAQCLCGIAVRSPHSGCVSWSGSLHNNTL